MFIDRRIAVCVHGSRLDCLSLGEEFIVHGFSELEEVKYLRRSAHRGYILYVKRSALNAGKWIL